MRESHRRSMAFYMAFIPLACGAAVVRFAGAAPQSAGGSGYQLAKKVVLGGEGGWDYLLADPSTRRVFLSRGTHTMVVDADGKLLGDVPKTAGVHGIALAPEFNRGFTSNGQANTVTIFDLTTLATIAEVKVTGQNPDAILYDPATKRIFTMNGRTGDSTAIDAKTGEVAGTIALGGKPETGQADGAGHIYVNLEDKSAIAEVDSSAMKLLNTWPIAPCDEPSGLAFDAAHQRLFAGCGNKMMAVIDATNGKVVATVPIGQGVDANAFDPGTGYAFASCGDGTITVAHQDTPDTYTVVDTIRTQRGARTMTVDTKTHTVYTVTAEYGPASAATPDNPRPRPTMVSNTFTLLIYSQGPQGAAHAATVAPGSVPAPTASAVGSTAPGAGSQGTDASSLAATGKALYSSYRCFDCHGMKGEGTDNAPDLVGTLLSSDGISAFLQKPSADADTKGMPSFAASSPDLPPLVAYVLTLKRAPSH